jgi:phage terminase large subunit
LSLARPYAGTGKSRACLEKLLHVALLNPGMRGLIVRKTLSSLGSTALVTWREHVAKEAIRAGDCEFYGGSPQESPQYRFTNGSSIVIGGMDKASRIMSSEYDMVYVQEATELTEDDWEALLTRLRHGKVSFQQIIADCNPHMPTHWLHDRADKGTTVLLESRHEDNPLYFDDDGQMTPAGHAYIEGKLDKLTGVRYLRLRKGLWVAAEGLVYENWDPAIHLIDWFRPPDEWPRYWAVDFGYTHPFVCQHWCEDPDGRLILYREFYRTRRTVDQHAEDILAEVTEPVPDVEQIEGLPINDAVNQGRRRWTEPRPRALICDHDAEGRAQLHKHLGMSTTPAKKAITEGVQAVDVRLRKAGDGKPRMMIMRDSLVRVDENQREAKKPTCFVDEIVGYIWAKGADDKAKELPRKEEDDAMDTARYLAAYRDLRSRPNVRWIQ